MQPVAGAAFRAESVLGVRRPPSHGEALERRVPGRFFERQDFSYGSRAAGRTPATTGGYAATAGTHVPTSHPPQASRSGDEVRRAGAVRPPGSVRSVMPATCGSKPSGLRSAAQSRRAKAGVDCGLRPAPAQPRRLGSRGLAPPSPQRPLRHPATRQPARSARTAPAHGGNPLVSQSSSPPFRLSSSPPPASVAPRRPARRSTPEKTRAPPRRVGAPAGLVGTWLHHVGRTLSDQEIEDISPPFVAAKGSAAYIKSEAAARSRVDPSATRVVAGQVREVDPRRSVPCRPRPVSIGASPVPRRHRTVLRCAGPCRAGTARAVARQRRPPMTGGRRGPRLLHSRLGRQITQALPRGPRGRDAKPATRRLHPDPARHRHPFGSDSPLAAWARPGKRQPPELRTAVAQP